MDDYVKRKLREEPVMSAHQAQFKTSSFKLSGDPGFGDPAVDRKRAKAGCCGSG